MSRLDRLVTLLETGSTNLVRNTAASQLADIQKAHPEELFNLLNPVVPYLHNKQWETRIATAKAIAGIVEHVEKWDPNRDDPYDESIKSETTGHEVKLETLETLSIDVKLENGKNIADDDEYKFSLDDFDIVNVIKNGKRLLGSLGKEYDYSLADLDPAERLAAQKKKVTATLGMGGEYMQDDLINEKDFATTGSHGMPQTPRIDTRVDQFRNNGTSSPARVSFQSPMDTQQSPMSAVDDGGLSKRQQNLLKRKAKMNAKNQANKVRVVDLANTNYRRPSADQPFTPLETNPHPVKQESSLKTETSQATDYLALDTSAPADDTKIVAEFKGLPGPGPDAVQLESSADTCDWPFERLCETLLIDLFEPAWEIRHGAAMGLRDVIKIHGKGAGRVEGKSRRENDEANRRWLDDLTCRLCCIFVLDRFGDYVSDNVIAPIRETASQTLGALLLHLSSSSVHKVYRLLYRLVMQEDLDLEQPVWEICHGGMLGLKYLVAVRNDLLIKDPELLDGVVAAVMKGLADQDDDVRAVSAATLIPIASEFISLRPHLVDGLISVVWECLSHLKDDLSASTGSVMDLLAKLCSFPQVLEIMKEKASNDITQSFALLVPRLFPFLRHTITSVRSAVLRALLTFLGVKGEGTRGWIDGKALRLIFQNLLVERNEAVINLSLEVWMAIATELAVENTEDFVSEFSEHIDPLLTLLMTPIGISRHPFPMEPTLFIKPSGQTYNAVRPPIARVEPLPPPLPQSVLVVEEKKSGRGRKKSAKIEDMPVPSSTSHNVDAHVMQGDVDLVGTDVFMRTKIMAAKAFGKAVSLWPQEQSVEVFKTRLVSYLDSPFSTSQLVAAMVIEEYAKFSSEKSQLQKELLEALGHVLNDERPGMYRDLVPYNKIVRAQCQNLLNTFVDVGRVASSKIPVLAVVVQGEAEAGPESFGLVQADKIVGEEFTRLKKLLAGNQRLLSAQALADGKAGAQLVIDEARAAKEIRDTRIVAAAAGAYIAARDLPSKLNPVIRGVMDSVKSEENLDLQRRSALSVASLVELCSDSGRGRVAEKLTQNLCSFLVVDTSETPEFHINDHLESSILSLKKEEDRKEHTDPVAFERESRAARIKRRGAKEALENFAVRFGSQLYERVPKFRQCMEEPLFTAFEGELPETLKNADDPLGQEVVDGLSTIRALLPKFHPDLHPSIINLLPYIVKALQSRYSVFRYTAAKCFATICSVIPIQGMTTVVTEILPSIANMLELRYRQGAIELIYHLIHIMETDILPYVIFLIVPVLGRMSDSDNDIRLLATTTFATLVKLVPLEAGIPDPVGFPEELLKGRDRERQFISQMLDVHKVEAFNLPVAIKAELRSYQQEGVNWLAFLNKYHLHGILCDDMGLGKTLQTICIIASDHHMRAEEYEKTKSEESKRVPSLIICPSTLSGHWQQEIAQYAPFLTSMVYIGNPSERAKIRNQLGTTDIVITSYDICRNDIENISRMGWNYCVLDEGHIIKNSKAKLTQAVKKVSANHRLILSGTPIQNNVLELWSLFDFLMPGFLGTEKVFLDRFAKPIAASRNSKSSSKEQEAGALAIEALHKQVLPFLLRRLKEEVLDDLPPKIIQNYYCDLSDLQKQLYQDSSKQAKDPSLTGQMDEKAMKQHIFQTLQYLRKLCNSPALVLNEKHPKFGLISKQMEKTKGNIRDPIHAPKLGALKELLLDCGIGVEANLADGDLPAASNAISQHRALIFCQQKDMLDMVEKVVLKQMLPSVTYLRMDGSTDPRFRQDVVTKFNRDPSIDILLLTTHVGGLGLNLTGADTVIFVEHDWNPQKDMQAMDRAHRIGQKKVVNVYRLITRGTLEEKIMSLQRFKLDVASTVVNQQNAGLATMETDQILDLFNLGEGGVPETTDTREGEEAMDIDGNILKKGSTGVLDGLGELWDETQYDDLSLDTFIASMKA